MRWRQRVVSSPPMEKVFKPAALKTAFSHRCPSWCWCSWTEAERWTTATRGNGDLFETLCLFRSGWRVLVSAGSCDCCFQILNNSVVSHCSPQLFFPSDPQSRERQRIHPHVHACRQCRVMCYVLSCILSSVLWNTQGIPFVHLFLFFFLCLLLGWSSLKDHWLDAVGGHLLMCHTRPGAMKEGGELLPPSDLLRMGFFVVVIVVVVCFPNCWHACVYLLL